MTEDTGASSYAIECWESQNGYKIKAQLKHHIGEEDWSTERVHLFALESGKFAVVTERGCSCYGYNDAESTVYEDEKSALAAYEEEIKR